MQHYLLVVCLFVASCSSMSAPADEAGAPDAVDAVDGATAAPTGDAVEGADASDSRAPKVLFIGMDGVRPDAMRVATTPHIDALRERGAWSDLGSTELATVTDSSAGWTTLLTGVGSAAHGVVDNDSTTLRDWAWPSFAALAHDAGYETAGYAHWVPFLVALHDAGSLDRSGFGTDDRVRDQVVAELEDHDADVIVVHFDDPDAAGHAHGFAPDVAPYVTAIKDTDARIGDLLDAVEARPTYADEDWLILIVTDHGGEGTDHGALTPANQIVPFTIGGGSIEPGEWEGTMMHTDIAPTVIDHLGIMGAPAFEGRSLLR